MNMQGNTVVKVFNESANFIALQTDERAYIFEGAVDGKPTMNYVPFSGVEYANSRTSIFTTGMLVFDPSQQEDIYNALHMDDWKETVWRESDIDNAILHPTKAKMERMLAIRYNLLMERIRGKLTMFINAGDCHISKYVIDIVNGRYREILNGKQRTEIVLQSKDITPDATVEEMRVQNANLQRQIDELQKLWAQLGDGGKQETVMPCNPDSLPAQDGDNPVDVIAPEIVASPDATKPKRGRPSHK